MQQWSRSRDTEAFHLAEKKTFHNVSDWAPLWLCDHNSGKNHLHLAQELTIEGPGAAVAAATETYVCETYETLRNPKKPTKPTTSYETYRTCVPHDPNEHVSFHFKGHICTTMGFAETWLRQEFQCRQQFQDTILKERLMP